MRAYWVVAVFFLLSLNLHAREEMDTYVAECEKEGVEIPENEELDCAKGELIPIRKTICEAGKAPLTFELTTENYLQIEKKYGKPVTCDNPSELAAFPPDWRCMPNSRVRVIPGKRIKDSVCVMACRKFQIDEGPADKNNFDDVNLLCHNVKRGATCFFNSTVGEKRSRVDGKMGRPSGKNTSYLPVSRYSDQSQSLCIHCHSNDPFIMSPYIRALIEPKLKPFKRDVINGPYWAVGSQPAVEIASWKKRWVLKDAGAQTCLGCHRVGYSPDYCGYLEKRSLGELNTIPDAFNQQCPKQSSRWMPGHEKITPVLLAESQKAVKRIEHCCARMKKWAEESNQGNFYPEVLPVKPDPALDCEWEMLETREN